MPSQKCAFFLLFILVTSILPEQKFGKVSKEELTMTSIQEDPEADAVYLLDATKIQITKNFNLEMEFHYRIKILTEQGKNKYSDIHVFYRHEDKISHLKAYTILPNGKKIKLDKNQVFTKENERYNEMVFAFPNVEVGSVLEYEYQKWSEYIADLEPWYFQNPEITKICCLEIILPSGFNYNLFSSNHLNYDINPQKTKMVGPGNPNRQPTLFTWKFENVPGLKEEPYVINEMDYRGRLHFLIDSYRDPYGGMYKFYKSWEDIRKNLMEIYDPYISQKGKVKSIANALAVDSLSPKEQLKSIFDYVRSQINTAEYRGIMNDQLLKPEEVLEKKEGSAVEKNLLLIAMLKNSGFKVNPVMISTRDNGLLNERTPSFFQFNHMIVRTKLGMNEFLLDAGDIFCPFGFLPEEDFTNQGFCLLEKGEEFISIPKPKSINMGFTETEAVLTVDGDLECKTKIRYEDYRAIEQRHKLAKTNEESFIRNLIEDRFAEVTREAYKIIDKDIIEVPLNLEIQYKVNGYAQTTDDMIYLNPNFFHRVESNPFKKEKRRFDIEYHYIESVSELVTILLPQGFEVQELPSSVLVNGPNSTFAIQCKTNEQKIEYQKDLKIKQVIFPVILYQQLKDFYGKIVEANQAQVVLKKI